MHLQADLLVDELKHMVPELRIAGGSFVHWLPPDPRDLPPTDRQRVLLETQRDATGKCLTDLVASVGLAAAEPTRLASGARKWPAGYTGSVSHKGTTVVAAIASTDRMTSIGIDVEQRDAKGVPAIHGLNAAELPWSISGADGRAILLSIKETAYKALHPILRRPIDYSDIAVSWLPPDADRSCGVARAFGVTLDVRCSIAIPSWIVSAALWPVTATRSHTTSQTG